MRAELGDDRRWALLWIGLLVAAVAARDTTAASADEFQSPERVTILGYADHAMEPFVTRDGAYLLFNNLNHPAVDTNLHYAERVDASTFQYRGEFGGVNTPALEGVPSMDLAGTLYFVSPRSYAQTLSTIHRGSFAAGEVSDVELVSGISLLSPGMVNFDVEVSPDGSTLYFVDSLFGPGGPQTADLVVAARRRRREGRAGDLRRESSETPRRPSALPRGSVRSMASSKVRRSRPTSSRSTTIASMARSLRSTGSRAPPPRFPRCGLPAG